MPLVSTKKKALRNGGAFFLYQTCSLVVSQTILPLLRLPRRP